MWSISVLDNTLKISRKVAKELHVEDQKLAEMGSEIWYSLEDIVDGKGFITFNRDHMEHMDWFSNSNCKGLVSVLCENKVKGRVTFGSLDGDNSGCFWGYEFDGKGNMNKLTGELSWKKDK